jgi:hypothetical protein
MIGFSKFTQSFPGQFDVRDSESRSQAAYGLPGRPTPGPGPQAGRAPRPSSCPPGPPGPTERRIASPGNLNRPGPCGREASGLPGSPTQPGRRGLSLARQRPPNTGNRPGPCGSGSGAAAAAAGDFFEVESAAQYYCYPSPPGPGWRTPEVRRPAAGGGPGGSQLLPLTIMTVTSLRGVPVITENSRLGLRLEIPAGRPRPGHWHHDPESGRGPARRPQACQCSGYTSSSRPSSH